MGAYRLVLGNYKRTPQWRTPTRPPKYGLTSKFILLLIWFAGKPVTWCCYRRWSSLSGSFKAGFCFWRGLIPEVVGQNNSLIYKLTCHPVINFITKFIASVINSINLTNNMAILVGLLPRYVQIKNSLSFPFRLHQNSEDTRYQEAVNNEVYIAFSLMKTGWRQRVCEMHYLECDAVCEAVCDAVWQRHMT